MSRLLLFGILLLIPLAGLYESVYLGAEQEQRWQTLLGEAGEFLGDAAPPLRSMCENDERLSASRLCHRQQQIAELRALAGVALAVVLVWTVAMGAWGLGARVFRPLLRAGRVLVWVWLALLLLALLADVAVATLGVLLFETGLPRQMYPLGATATGLFGGTVLLLAGFATSSLQRSRAPFVIAAAVDNDSQRRLAALVGDLATRLEAWPPEHLVLGLQPGLYVTGVRHYLHPAEQVLSLPLVYLSLPLLRVLTRDEMVALLAHELAHWNVAEQHYSRAVHPALADLERATARGPGGFAGLIRWPALTVLGLHLAMWRRAQTQHERMRELLADEVAAALLSPHALASALLKLAVLESEWRAQDADLEKAVAEGRRAKNLAAVFQRRLDLLEPRDWLREMAESRASHPCDTHAALFDRVGTIGIGKDELGTVSMAAPAAPAIALISDAERVEESLSDAQHFLYKSRVENAAEDH